MPLPSSGSISLSQVNVELNKSATTTTSLNDTDVRTLFQVASGTISMSNGYGKANAWAATLNITANTNNYNIRDAANSAGYPQTIDANITVNISPGVYVGSASTGSAAMDVGPWPTGSSITINNSGTIVGRGGDGGAGGPAQGNSPTYDILVVPGSPGLTGGTGLVTARPVTISNSGTIAGGGGGGGGSGGGSAAQPRTPNVWTVTGGSGGGGGIGVSTGGAAGIARLTPLTNIGNGSTPGIAGVDGTLVTAGTGGSGATVVSPNTATGTVVRGAGGDGGTYGSSGADAQPTTSPNPLGYVAGSGTGGAAGAAVSGNPLVTWTSTGTRSGPLI